MFLEASYLTACKSKNNLLLNFSVPLCSIHTMQLLLSASHHFQLLIFFSIFFMLHINKWFLFTTWYSNTHTLTLINAHLFLLSCHRAALRHVCVGVLLVHVREFTQHNKPEQNSAQSEAAALLEPESDPFVFLCCRRIIAPIWNQGMSQAGRGEIRPNEDKHFIKSEQKE